MRQLARKMRTKSSLRTPRRTTFMGGMTRPSWNSSWHDGAIELGTEPPTSVKWIKHHP